MYRKHKSTLWVSVLMLMSAFYLFTGTATGDPLIITVRQTSLLETLPQVESMERIEANGVEILQSKSPQAPTGLDEQLAFIPEPIEDEQLDGQIERREPQPSAPPHIVIDSWQPGSYSNIDLDRMNPDRRGTIIEHRYRGRLARPSLIVTHRYGQGEKPSRIITHRYDGSRDRPTLIITHR